MQTNHKIYSGVFKRKLNCKEIAENTLKMLLSSYGYTLFMITGIGIDIVEISRFQKILQTENFIEKCFSVEERELDLQSLAGRFAAREALFKALDKKQFFRLSEIQIINEVCGQPKFVLSGGMLEYCKDKEIILTISHEIGYAVSFVLIQSINLEF